MSSSRTGHASLLYIVPDSSLIIWHDDHIFHDVSLGCSALLAFIRLRMTHDWGITSTPFVRLKFPLSNKIYVHSPSPICKWSLGRSWKTIFSSGNSSGSTSMLLVFVCVRRSVHTCVRTSSHFFSLRQSCGLPGWNKDSGTHAPRIGERGSGSERTWSGWRGDRGRCFKDISHQYIIYISDLWIYICLYVIFSTLYMMLHASSWKNHFWSVLASTWSSTCFGWLSKSLEKTGAL